MNRVKTFTFGTNFLLFLLILLVILLGLLGKLIFNPNIISSSGDLRNNFWSLYSFLQESWQLGQGVSFWYPVKDGGISIYGHPSWGLGYPLYWLYFFFPASQASSLIIFISFFCTGIFSYLLGSHVLKLSFWSSVFLALSMTLSPKFFAHLYAGHITLITSIPFIPLILLLYFLLIAKKSFKIATLLALSVALMSLTGGAQILFYTLVVLALVTLIGLVTMMITRGYKVMLKTIWEMSPFLGYSVLLSLLLSSFQLIPYLTHITLSQRSQLNYWEVAIPGLYLKDIGDLLFSTRPDLSNHETVFHLGIIPALLLPLGLLYKSKIKWLALILLLITFLFALGANNPLKIHRLFYEIIPGFKYFRVPTRMLFQFIPFFLILSAFGFEWFTRQVKNKKYSTLIAEVLVVISSIQLIIYNINFITPVPSPDQDVEILETASMLHGLYPNSSPPPRTYSTNRSLSENSIYLSGGQSADGIEDLFLADYVNFMKLAGNYRFSGYSTSIPPSQTYDKTSLYFEEPTPNAAILGLLNVKYVFSPYELQSPDFQPFGKFKDSFYYENKKLVPRAYLTYNTVLSTDISDLTTLQTDKTVLVTEKAKLIKSDLPIKAVPIKNYSSNKIELETSSDSESFLVLSEIKYPYWQVYVDNAKAQLVNANYLFRAVYLEKGNHQVSFVYQPPGFWMLNLISFLTLAFSVMVVLGKPVFTRKEVSSRIRS